MKVIQNSSSRIHEVRMHFLLAVIAWNSSVLFAQEIERLTDGDTFRNPSPSCEINSCNTFNSRTIGGHCTAKCCTCKCSSGRGATYVEHKKQCVEDTSLFESLSVGKTGCQFRSTTGCTRPKLQALGKESNGKTSLYVCSTENQGKGAPLNDSITCQILSAEVLSSGNWKLVTPKVGNGNVFKFEIGPTKNLELKWMINLMSIFGNSIVRLTLKCSHINIDVRHSCYIFKTATNNDLPPATVFALTTDTTKLSNKSFQVPVTPLNSKPTLTHNRKGRRAVQHKLTSPHAVVAAVALSLVLLLVVGIVFLLVHKKKSGTKIKKKHTDAEDSPPEPVPDDYDDNFDSDFDSDFDSESGKEEPVYAVIEEIPPSSTKDSQHNNSLIKKQVAVAPDGYLEPQDFVPDKPQQSTEEKKQKVQNVVEHADTSEDIYHQYCTVGGIVKSEASTKGKTSLQDKISSQSVASSTDQYCKAEMAI